MDHFKTFRRGVRGVSRVCVWRRGNQVHISTVTFISRQQNKNILCMVKDCVTYLQTVFLLVCEHAMLLVPKMCCHGNGRFWGGCDVSLMVTRCGAWRFFICEQLSFILSKCHFSDTVSLWCSEMCIYLVFAKGLHA